MEKYPNWCSYYEEYFGQFVALIFSCFEEFIPSSFYVSKKILHCPREKYGYSFIENFVLM